MNEKSPNHPFCCCLAIGRKKGGGSFVFRGEREAKNEKKKSKISPFLGFTFSSRGQREKKKKQFLLSQTAFLSPGPSVVEEDLEDLEDVHHRGDV